MLEGEGQLNEKLVLVFESFEFLLPEIQIGSAGSGTLLGGNGLLNTSDSALNTGCAGRQSTITADVMFATPDTRQFGKHVTR